MENHRLIEELLKLTQMQPINIIPFGADYSIGTNADGNGNYQTVTYKKGGSSGILLKTVTYTFDANSKIVTTTITG